MSDFIIDKEVIANYPEIVLDGQNVAYNQCFILYYLRSLNFIRNVCAHHSRLWNINVLERAPVPHYEHWQKINNSRPFFYFCLMQKLLAVISPNSAWNKRFEAIVESFPEPENNAIRISEFGIVDDWESWPVWGLK